MPASSLTPVFVGLRTGLHVLVAGLTVFVVVQARSGPSAAHIPIGGSPIAVHSACVAAISDGTMTLGPVTSAPSSASRRRSRTTRAGWSASTT